MLAKGWAQGCVNFLSGVNWIVLGKTGPSFSRPLYSRLRAGEGVREKVAVANVSPSGFWRNWIKLSTTNFSTLRCFSEKKLDFMVIKNDDMSSK